jgi:hypothetical protein
MNVYYIRSCKYCFNLPYKLRLYCRRLVVYPLLHMVDNHLSLERMDLLVLVVFVKPEMSVSLKLETAPHVLSQRVFLCVSLCLVH